MMIITQNIEKDNIHINENDDDNNDDDNTTDDNNHGNDNDDNNNKMKIIKIYLYSNFI